MDVNAIRRSEEALILGIKNSSSNPNPEYKTEFSSGLDLRADLTQKVRVRGPKIDGDSQASHLNENGSLVLEPMQRAIIQTSCAFKLPEGFEATVRQRSGFTFEEGIMVALGTIDNDFTGQVGIILFNLSGEDAVIKHGDRIAQLVVTPVEFCRALSIDELPKTGRGANGFGHTGRD
jgi:dUTP pyrophosphatase